LQLEPVSRCAAPLSEKEINRALTRCSRHSRYGTQAVALHTKEILVNGRASSTCESLHHFPNF
jgi:hypothetical protein